MRPDMKRLYDLLRLWIDVHLPPTPTDRNIVFYIEDHQVIGDRFKDLNQHLLGVFSAEALGSLAAEMLLKPTEWQQPQHMHAYYQGGDRINVLVSRALQHLVVYYPAADIHILLEARLKQMFQHPYDSNEILRDYDQIPPDYYFFPKLHDCLRLMIRLPTTPALLNLMKRLLLGEMNYERVKIPERFKTPDKSTSYSTYSLGVDFSYLLMHLYQREELSYDLFRQAVMILPDIVAPYTRIHQRRQLENSIEGEVDVMDKYHLMLLDEIAADLSEKNYRPLLKSYKRLEDIKYLLLAAKSHAELGLGKLVVNSSYVLYDHVESAVIKMALTKPATPLTDAERNEVIEKLRQYPKTTLEKLLPVSVHNANLLVEALNWQPAGRLIKQLTSHLRVNEQSSITCDSNSPDSANGVIDVAAVRAAFDAIDPLLLAKVLRLFTEARIGLEPLLMLYMALGGTNRAEIIKSFGKHSQNAIKAYGLLPIQADETVLDRYTALKKSAKEGQKFGQQRRANHAAAVKSGLANLAQVAGYPDASRLEWAMETQLVEDVGADGRQWQVGEYELQLRVEGVEANIVISRSGNTLKSVPANMRTSEAYKAAKESVAQLRAQTSRLRNELVEGLIASGDLLSTEEIKRLLHLPAARDMFSRLIWRTTDEHYGVLDVDSFSLVGLDGNRYPIETPIGIAHPYHLYENGTLAAWQREIVKRRIVQPIKQAFRELYLLTPAERATNTYSNRFAGHSVDAATTGRLLSGRGWRVETGDNPLPYKTFPGVRAAMEIPDAQHYLGGSMPITTDCIYFQAYPIPANYYSHQNWQNRREHWLPLEQVPPLIFSEVMRDADLVVSVAQRDAETRISTETYEGRGQLVTALLDDLGLAGVTVEGHFAHVQGKLARYRVHLGSAVIHIEPGNYLCIVPDRWGKKRENLFLPFAEGEDAKTSEVISKILLLLADDKIKDESILRQIKRLS